MEKKEGEREEEEEENKGVHTQITDHFIPFILRPSQQHWTGSHALGSRVKLDTTNRASVSMQSSEVGPSCQVKQPDLDGRAKPSTHK